MSNVWWKHSVTVEELPEKLREKVQTYLSAYEGAEILECYKTFFEFGELVYDEYRVYLYAYVSAYHECCYMSLRVDPEWRRVRDYEVEVSKVDSMLIMQFGKLLQAREERYKAERKKIVADE